MNLIPHIFFLLMLVLFVLFFGLSSFALARPKVFAEWLSPYAWARNKIFDRKTTALDHGVSYCFGVFFFVALMTVSFGMGGFLTTAIFRLYEASPFAAIFYPI